MTQVTESDYRTAQKGNARVRQEFLDAVDLEDAREFVDGVGYLHTDIDIAGYILKNGFGVKKPKKGSIVLMDVRLGDIDAIMDRQMHHEKLVTVYSEAFNFLSCPLFLSSLLDHEGDHAKKYEKRFHQVDELENEQYSFNENSFWFNYFEALFELPSIANQIARAKRRRLTSDETRSIESDYFYYLEILKQPRIRKNKRRDLKKDLQKILCNSDGDNLIRQHLGIN